MITQEGKSALHIAAENGRKHIVAKLIIKNAFINAKTKLGLTPLHLAAQNGYHNVVEQLFTFSKTEKQSLINSISLVSFLFFFFKNNYINRVVNLRGTHLRKVRTKYRI